MAAVLLLFAVILLMRVVGLIVLSLADRPPTPLPYLDPCLAPLLDLPVTAPADPERALLADLRSGRISRHDYRTAMAALAAGEARAHPLQTPAGPDS